MFRSTINLFFLFTNSTSLKGSDCHGLKDSTMMMQSVFIGVGGIVNNTLRPPIPDHCDPEWRKLMEQCWSPDPAARPSFTEITNRLRVMSTALPTKGQSPMNR